MATIVNVIQLGYIENRKKHTIEYRDNMIRFVSNGLMHESRNGYDVPKGKYMLTVAPTFEAALLLMQKQIVETVQRISWLNADPNDLWFSIATAGVRQTQDVDATDADVGYFWVPNTINCRKYRLSDLEVV